MRGRLLAWVAASWATGLVTPSSALCVPKSEPQVLYVVQPYGGGLDPVQMESLVLNYYDFHFRYLEGIKKVESKKLEHSVATRLVFASSTDMRKAMADAAAYAKRSRPFMPPSVPAAIMLRFETVILPTVNLVLPIPVVIQVS